MFTLPIGLMGSSFEGLLPTEILGNSLIAWYRADNVSSISNFVSAWLDISGNNNHATQSDTMRQPTFIGNGFNGKPTLDFRNEAWLSMPNCLSNSWGSASLLALFDLLDDTQHWAVTHLGSPSNGQYWGTNGTFGYAGYFGEFRNSRLEGIPANMTVPGKTLIEVISNSSTYTVTRNTTQLCSETSDFGITTTPYIGRDNAYTMLMNGKISEIILVDRAITNTERDELRLYLKSFWDLTMY